MKARMLQHLSSLVSSEKTPSPSDRDRRRAGATCGSNQGPLCTH